MKAYSRATEDAEQDTLYSHREQIEDQLIERDGQARQVAGNFSAKPVPFNYRNQRASFIPKAAIESHLEGLEQTNQRRLKKASQPESTPGSDLVDSADTTAAVSAPDISTSGALASGAVGAGQVLETSRQSDPTLQTRPNDFEDRLSYARQTRPNDFEVEDRLSYARFGPSSHNTPWLAYPDLAGGVPNDGSSSLYPAPSSTLNEPISTAPDWVSYRLSTSTSSLPPLWSTHHDWVLYDPKYKPEIEHSTT